MSRLPDPVKDEIDRFLELPLELVKDPIAWWRDHRNMFPNLHRMAIDYLSIPRKYFFTLTSPLIWHILTPSISATSVDVERVFSRGRLILSHVWNRLSAQPTCAQLCLGYWSHLGLVRDADVFSIAEKEDLEGSEDPLPNGWDKIVLSRH